MKKYLLGSLSILIVFHFLLPTAFAAEATLTCTPIYGGGQSCIDTDKITLDKKVQSPNNKTFVDSLGASDPKYLPDQKILFKITVKNSSNTTLENIEVQDTLPEYVKFVKGTGTYDSEKHIFTYKIVKLEKGKSNSLELEGAIVKADTLPSSEPTTCTANHSLALIQGDSAIDNTPFCIAANADSLSATNQPENKLPSQPQSPVVGSTSKRGKTLYQAPNVTTNPNTGPEIVAVISLVPLALTGLALRLRSKKYL